LFNVELNELDEEIYWNNLNEEIASGDTSRVDKQLKRIFAVCKSKETFEEFRLRYIEITKCDLNKEII
jgi:hypothetical protein